MLNHWGHVHFNRHQSQVSKYMKTCSLLLWVHCFHWGTLYSPSWTDIFIWLRPQTASGASLRPFEPCHPRWDSICSQRSSPSFPVRGGPGPPEGYWTFGLSASDPHICANITSDHLKEARAVDTDMDIQATVVLMCTESQRGELYKTPPPPWSWPHAVLRTTSHHVNNQPGVYRFWVKSRSAVVFLCSLGFDLVVSCVCSSCFQGHWVSNTFSQSKPFL